MKVLIADDHPVIRQGLHRILSTVFGPVACTECADAQAAVAAVAQRDWDVAIVDIGMPGRSGLDVLKEIKRMRPELPVLIISVHPESQYAVRALRAGAAGYLRKDAAPHQLVEAVTDARKGKKFISPELAEELANHLQRGSSQATYHQLSDREMEVLRLLAGGKTVSQIADQLALSVKTVSTYRARTLKKLHLRSNAQLTRFAFAEGLVE